MLPLLFSTTSFAQDYGAVKDSVYQLGQYKIYPYKKLITVQTHTRGSFPEGGEWWGMAWIPVERNYDSVEIIIMGHWIMFKENLPFDCDLNTAEVIGKWYYSYEVVKDKNALYFGKNKIDLRPYKYINDFIYRGSKDDYYLLDPNQGFHFEKIDKFEKLHLPTLKHVAGYFFYDKNGLHRLFRQYDEKCRCALLIPEKIATNTSGKEVPKIFRRYFFYANRVFTTVNELTLVAKKTKEIVHSETPDFFGTLTDGKKFYKGAGYESSEVNPNDYHGSDDFFRSGADFEIPIPDGIPLFRSSNDKYLHFAEKKPFQQEEEAVQKTSLLTKTKAGYQLLHYNSESTVLEKIGKILIYNADTKKEEVFQSKAFKYLAPSLFIYKDRLYYNNIPVMDTIDVKNLRILIIGGFETNFLTDEKCLINTKNLRASLRLVNKKGDNFISLQNAIIREVNFKYLKAVSQDMLVDDKNIYSQDQRIPISKLGLKIRIYTIRESGYTDFGF